MKQSFHRKIIIVIIFSLLFCSCKIAGDFSITKRKYMKGYYIVTPFFTEKPLVRASKVLNHEKQPKEENIDNKNINDNFITSTDSTLILTEFHNKKGNPIPGNENILPKIIEYKNAIIKRSIKNNIRKKINNSNITDNKKLYKPALIAFILSLISFIILFASILINFSNLALFVQLILLGLLVLSPIIGIILGFISRSKIKKNPDKLKGLGFAKAAIIIGFSFFIIFLIILIISALKSIFETI